jgi:ribosomal-protein-alanine N-acetyltransferase
MNIEFARREDAQQIAEMSRDLIEAGLDWRWRPERIWQAILDRETAVIKAEISSRLAGFAIMRFHWAEEAHLDLLAVKPLFRRSGIGATLLSWLESSALTAGVSIVRLELREINKQAMQFYKHRGYQTVRNIPRYYSERETAIAMAHDLWSDVSAREIK